MPPLVLLLLGAAPSFWVASPDVKLRPNAAAGADRAATLDAGRGECAAFQLALRAGSEGLRSLSIDASDFAPALGARLDVSRELFVRLDRPSGPEGEAGDWPDPLVPAVDELVHERRNAFPTAVAPGGLAVAWLQLCVPPRALPGRYRAEVRLTDGARPLGQLPVSLEVHRYELPATATLPTSFGISLISLLHRHRVKGPKAEAALLRRYAVLALRHRLSLHGMSMEPPPFQRAADGLSLDFEGYDQELRPLLDGSAIPTGARFTTTELRTASGLSSDAEKISYWRAFARHLSALGFRGLLFDYAADEPTSAQFPAIVARARLVHEADPRLRVLVTVPYQSALEGSVDIWAPNLNCLAVKRDPKEFCPLRAPEGAYAPRLAKGEGLWWYVSCSSFGCGGKLPRGATRYFFGWPSYVIDAKPSRARALGALAYGRGIEGELYYDTVLSYDDGDPWQSTYRFGGNGDGTLFYPGTPDRIGGKTDIPLSSLRLELIRLGQQDHAELTLLGKLGDPTLATELAHALAPSADRVDVAPARLASARARLRERLDALTAVVSARDAR
ncbi:MAG: DUF4091 domain-containing protein [Deltaproteobacteria bacterium]